MKSIEIKGKQYVVVAERIRYFRSASEFAGWSIETEITSLTDASCTMRALIHDAEGRLRSTGTAHEEYGSSNINKTSYVENCETSAVGRALGLLGVGITDEIASAEEKVNAIYDETLNPGGLTLYRAQKYKTKDGRLFGELSYAELELIFRNDRIREDTRQAAKICLDAIGSAELEPLDGEGGEPA